MEIIVPKTNDYGVFGFADILYTHKTLVTIDFLGFL